MMEFMIGAIFQIIVFGFVLLLFKKITYFTLLCSLIGLFSIWIINKIFSFNFKNMEAKEWKKKIN